MINRSHKLAVSQQARLLGDQPGQCVLRATRGQRG